MNGKIASKGMAFAAACLICEPEIRIEQQKTGNPQRELERFRAAQARCAVRLEELIGEAEQRENREAGEILDFQLLMLEDTDYLGKIEQKILRENWGCEYAVDEASKSYQQYLRSLTDNPYLRERATDVGDLSKRLICELLGIDDSIPEPEGPYIVVAEDLTPSQVTELDDRKLKGIILEKGALAAHAVIIAKSRGIPCLINVSGVTGQVRNGQDLLLDCFKGRLIVEPDENEILDYRRYSEEQQREAKLLEAYRQRRTETTDGFGMKVFANITSCQETEELVRQGGEGVGLFRTELLYMEKSSAPPSEAAQYEVYKKAAQTLEGRLLIIRTLDVGGDKKIPYLDIPPEDNPFLGYRAIRYCLEHEDLFREQLSAILRASAYGTVAVMFPMISTQDEIMAAKGILDSVKAELSEKGIAFDPAIKVGMMVETPAAALDARRFAGLVDFFSIGTNDLTQYLFAADRMNDRVSHLNSYFQPGLLRCVNHIVSSAHAAGIEVDICGQAGELQELIPVWIGMGVDGLSVSIPMITRVRRTICEASKAECERLLSQILNLDTEAEAREALAAGRA